MKARIDRFINCYTRAFFVVFLFGLSLGFFIPPIPSDPSSKYTFFPGGALGVLLFALSCILNNLQGRLRIFVVVVETILITIFGYLIYLRVNDF